MLANSSILALKYCKTPANFLRSHRHKNEGMGTTVAQDVWSAALGELQLQLPRSTYETWLKDTSGVAIEDQSMVVSVPNAFTADWLEKRIFRLVRKTVNKVSPQPLEVKFRIGGCAPTNPDLLRSPVNPLQGSPSFPNRRYSFTSFVVGSSNNLAFTASEAAARAPGQCYNPLFIYSGVGLGKTHLLHAIARNCMDRRLKYLYVTSEQFTNEFITSIRERTTEKFRSRYRSVDVLLMDDIQFMAGKEQTQEGFFHTFNDLHNSNRQLVITSDRPPSTMQTLEDRLRSRFSWGLIADIQPPPLETRIAILQAKAREMQAAISDEVVTFIAHRVRNNVRNLEGALNRIVATSRLANGAVDLEMAAGALQGLGQDSQQSPPSPEMVMSAVAKVFNVDQQDLQGRKRHKELTTARQVAMFLLNKELGLAVTRVGRLLGGKNHSTVIHGVSKVDAELNVNADLSQKVQAVKEKFLGAS